MCNSYNNNDNKIIIIIINYYYYYGIGIKTPRSDKKYPCQAIIT